MNKSGKSLDGIVSVRNRKIWAESSGHSPTENLLAYALARCGACRESYYSGQLSGVPCTNLMKRVLVFCALFAHQWAGPWDWFWIRLPLYQVKKKAWKIWLGSTLDHCLRAKRNQVLLKQPSRMWCDYGDRMEQFSFTAHLKAWERKLNESHWEEDHNMTAKFGASHLKCLYCIAFRSMYAVCGVSRLPRRFFSAVFRTLPTSFKQTEAETNLKQVCRWPNLRRSTIFVYS